MASERWSCVDDRSGRIRIRRAIRSGPVGAARRGVSVEVVTFGCRLNAYESDQMRAAAHGASADNVVIINTCAVTAEAVRQARQTIRAQARAHPDARIVVTGCAAQTDPAMFATMPEVT